MFTISDVQCEPLSPPENGKSVFSDRNFKAGEILKFVCNHGYMMQGNPVVACQDDGIWSGPPPKCKCKDIIFLPRTPLL